MFGTTTVVGVGGGVLAPALNSLCGFTIFLDPFAILPLLANTFYAPGPVCVFVKERAESLTCRYAGGENQERLCKGTRRKR